MIHSLYNKYKNKCKTNLFRDAIRQGSLMSIAYTDIRQLVWKYFYLWKLYDFAIFMQQFSKMFVACDIISNFFTILIVMSTPDCENEIPRNSIIASKYLPFYYQILMTMLYKYSMFLRYLSYLPYSQY